MSLTAIVLGSSAGGGLPQWNCNCANCAGVRAGQPGLQARTQSSVAWSRNGQDWLRKLGGPYQAVAGDRDGRVGIEYGV